MISQEFFCKCKRQKTWVVEGKKIDPCPECGRIYEGVYDKKKMQIIGKEVSKK